MLRMQEKPFFLTIQLVTVGFRKKSAHR